MKNNNIKTIGDLCTACSACKSMCPTEAIEFKENIEGFMYPFINETKCINCGLCKKVCPLLNIKELKNNQFKKKYYAFCTKNNDIWKKSTSGGAFSEICHIVEEKNTNTKTYIYGCTMSKIDAYHIECDYENIYKLRKSKYIQSDINNCYQSIKKRLIEKSIVIFVGTPCQVAGLKSYLRKGYENLILIDFICHGVSNKKILKKCLEFLEKKFNKKITSYDFRYKDKFFTTSERYKVKYNFEDGGFKTSNNDLFMKLYLKELVLRKSCGDNCKFRDSNRCSDITLADFNNKSMILPKLYDRRNYSTVICNTQKGELIINELKKHGNFISCDEIDIKKYNPLFYSNTSNSSQKHINIFDNENILNEFANKSNKNKFNIQKYVPYIILYLGNRFINFFKKRGKNT